MSKLSKWEPKSRGDYILVGVLVAAPMLLFAAIMPPGYPVWIPLGIAAFNFAVAAFVLPWSAERIAKKRRKP